MAHLLSAEDLTIGFGSRVVLDHVGLGLGEGDRIGVVGRNGDGKSTLLRLLAGAASPDSGRVVRRRDLTSGYLDQADVLDPASTVRRAVVGDVPDHVWASDPRIRDVLDGLLAGVPGEARVEELSGGQRRRVALAHLLAGTPDVVMLDEPTNHLDVEGVAWLADHLRRRWPAGRGALVVVTHDRWFLDAVTDHTWEVHDATVDQFDGGYAAYVLARAERDRQAAATEARRQNLMRKELAWLRRGAPARTSKPRFRLDAAAALIADEPEPRDTTALVRMATARLGKDVLDLEDVSYRLPGQRPDAPALFDRITWHVGPGERWGVVGVNGAGKTTLLRLLTGELVPTGGRIRRGQTVRTALLSQQVDELGSLGEKNPVEVLRTVRDRFVIGVKEYTAAQLVELVGFTRQRAFTRVAELSGGERRRLQLVRLLAGEPNVLLLDEPTNDLDTDTLAAVEDLLDGWPGTLIVVSHDRYLLERVTDRQLALLGDGRLRDLPGGVDQYLELRRGAGREDAPEVPAVPASRPTGATASAAQRQATKDLARIERKLDRIAGRERELMAALEVAAADYEQAARLDAERQRLAAERTELEEEWMTASEVLE